MRCIYLGIGQVEMMRRIQGEHSAAGFPIQGAVADLINGTETIGEHVIMGQGQPGLPCHRDSAVSVIPCMGRGTCCRLVQH